MTMPISPHHYQYSLLTIFINEKFLNILKYLNILFCVNLLYDIHLFNTPKRAKAFVKHFLKE